jgi:hypothetical protein
VDTSLEFLIVSYIESVPSSISEARKKKMSGHKKNPDCPH